MDLKETLKSILLPTKGKLLFTVIATLILAFSFPIGTCVMTMYGSISDFVGVNAPYNLTLSTSYVGSFFGDSVLAFPQQCSAPIYAIPVLLVLGYAATCCVFLLKGKTWRRQFESDVKKLISNDKNGSTTFLFKAFFAPKTLFGALLHGAIALPFSIYFIRSVGLGGIYISLGILILIDGWFILYFIYKLIVAAYQLAKSLLHR